MICRILLLIQLTSCVCGTFVVNVTQTYYQAEENQKITMEWTFTTNTGSSTKSIYVLCLLVTNNTFSIVFYLHGGVEVPQVLHEQFAGRVQWDKDVLTEGRVRLHVSRLMTNDTGLYVCEVQTNYGINYAVCHLNVTAATGEPKPQRPTVSPQPESRGRIVFSVGLGLTAAAALLTVCAGL